MHIKEQTASNKDKISTTILLAPSLEMARTVTADATVEAEYGDDCVEGRLVTLAHHGRYSRNHAPCNTPNVPVLPDGSVILVSHLDLDTIGGIQKLTGKWTENNEFWSCEEYIDVNGVHHIDELPARVQDKMNAVNAWTEKNVPQMHYTEITDVTDIAKSYSAAVNVILNEEDEKHDVFISEGRKWKENIDRKIESKLFLENEAVRAFITDGIFCSASYCSHQCERTVPATVVFNELTGTITIAFRDGGKNVSALEIVRKLWGQEAGGRDGIAGSPRGKMMTKNDFQSAIDEVTKEVNMTVKCQNAD